MTASDGSRGGRRAAGQHIRKTSVTEERTESFNYRQFNATFIELAIHLGFIGLLVSWTFVLIRPFIPIIVWSVVLTVALYPVFDWLAGVLGGRRGLAAALITIFGLLVVIGPVTWMGLGLIDGLKTLIERLDSGKLSIPPPSETVRDWPLVGPQFYDFWTLASTNVRSALTYLLPQLRPLGEILLNAASNVGTWTLQFLVSVIIAGLIGIGGRLTAPPLPHHRAYGSVPRRFDRVKLWREHGVGEDRVSRNSGCAVPVGPPGVLTCARTPSANRRRPLHGTSIRRDGAVP